jgi:hypothetical protein
MAKIGSGHLLYRKGPGGNKMLQPDLQLSMSITVYWVENLLPHIDGTGAEKSNDNNFGNEIELCGWKFFWTPVVIKRHNIRHSIMLILIKLWNSASTTPSARCRSCYYTSRKSLSGHYWKLARTNKSTSAQHFFSSLCLHFDSIGNCRLILIRSFSSAFPLL